MWPCRIWKLLYRQRGKYFIHQNCNLNFYYTVFFLNILGTFRRDYGVLVGTSKQFYTVLLDESSVLGHWANGSIYHYLTVPPWPMTCINHWMNMKVSVFLIDFISIIIFRMGSVICLFLIEWVYIELKRMLKDLCFNIIFTYFI